MGRIKNLSIKQKLLGGFLFSSLIVLVVGGIGFITIMNNLTHLRKMIEYDLEEFKNLEEFQIFALQHRRYEKDFFLNIPNREAQNKYLQRFKDVSGKTIDLMSQMDASAEGLSQEEIGLRQDIKIAYMKYKKGFLQVTEKVLSDQDITPQEANALMNPFKENVYNFEKKLAISLEHGLKNINAVSDSMIQSGQKSEFLIGVLLLTGVIASIVMGLIIAQLMTKPIFLAVKFADKISHGDLTQHIDVQQKDEIGVLTDALNSMSSNLRKIFSEIASGSQSLSASSTELASISNEMSLGSEQTFERSNNVASAAEEMSANMGGVAAATEQTSINLQMIVAASEELSATINEVAQNIGKGSQITTEAVKKAEGISKKMGNLGQAALEITQVTETIADISEQTNLLALNATIEAARAGEAGKGFAVVAGEIKTLAQQTAGATGEINQRIGNVQALTKESVTAIESIVLIISDINEIVSSVAAAIEEQSATTQDISGNVSQAAQGIQEVNENVNQASAVSNEVSSAVQGVSALAGEMKTNSAHVSTSASELSKLSEELNAMLRQFKLQ